MISHQFEVLSSWNQALDRVAEGAAMSPEHYIHVVPSQYCCKIGVILLILRRLNIILIGIDMMRAEFWWHIRIV